MPDQRPIYACDPCECGGTPGCPICDPLPADLLTYYPPPAGPALPTLGPRLVLIGLALGIAAGIWQLARWAL